MIMVGWWRMEKVAMYDAFLLIVVIAANDRLQGDYEIKMLMLI
jgi:hypothetical protein